MVRRRITTLSSYIFLNSMKYDTEWKVSAFGVILVLIFPHSEIRRVKYSYESLVKEKILHFLTKTFLSQLMFWKVLFEVFIFSSLLTKASTQLFHDRGLIIYRSQFINLLNTGTSIMKELTRFPYFKFMFSWNLINIFSDISTPLRLRIFP